MKTNEFQQRLKQFYKETGGFEEENLLSVVILAENIGEVARILREMEYGSHPLNTTPNTYKTNKNLLSEKLGDILGTITFIANQHDIQLQDICKNHIEKLEKIHTMMHN